MKSVWVGALSLLLSSPLLAQTVEELQGHLMKKEAEIQELRERIRVLERQVTPIRIEQAHAAPGAAADVEMNEDSNRGLERALVRERGLLLSSGVAELEPNFVYSHLNNGDGFRRDSFGPGLALRVGLPWRTQLELALPYVVERRRDGNDSTRAHGIGDFNIGIAHQFVNESHATPGLIGAINYQASTGRNTLFKNATPVALGGGFNSIQGTLTAIKRSDPLVLFGSYSFTHNFAETKNGTRVDPGNTHGLRFGTGLATGPETSLRAAFNLTFFDKTKFGDRSLSGTDDPMGVLEFGGSLVLTKSTALDVMMGVGATRNAPDFRLTVALPVRF